MRTLTKIVARGVADQALKCVEYGLRCLDPPALTSGMLKRYGVHSEHTILSFWRALDRILEKVRNLTIYKSKYMDFNLVLTHSLEDVYLVKDLGIYVDPVDCEDRECVAVPHTHVLKIYLVGSYEGTPRIRINVVNLLSIVIAREPEFRKCLENLVEDPTSVRRVVEIARCVYILLRKYNNVLARLMDRVPDRFSSFVNISPFLRSVLKALVPRTKPAPPSHQEATE